MNLTKNENSFISSTFKKIVESLQSWKELQWSIECKILNLARQSEEKEEALNVKTFLNSLIFAVYGRSLETPCEGILPLWRLPRVENSRSWLILNKNFPREDKEPSLEHPPSETSIEELFFGEDAYFLECGQAIRPPFRPTSKFWFFFSVENEWCEEQWRKEEMH